MTLDEELLALGVTTVEQLTAQINRRQTDRAREITTAVEQLQRSMADLVTMNRDYGRAIYPRLTQGLELVVTLIAGVTREARDDLVESMAYNALIGHWRASDDPALREAAESLATIETLVFPRTDLG